MRYLVPVVQECLQLSGFSLSEHSNRDSIRKGNLELLALLPFAREHPAKRLCIFGRQLPFPLGVPQKVGENQLQPSLLERLPNLLTRLANGGAMDVRQHEVADLVGIKQVDSDFYGPVTQDIALQRRRPAPAGVIVAAGWEGSAVIAFGVVLRYARH